MANVFSLTRTLKLIRKDLLSEYKNLFIWLGSATGVMIVISAISILIMKMNGLDYRVTDFHRVFYILLLFPGGYILTSTMFKDAHDKSRNIYWLTIPGSTFEKLVSRLFISSILFAVLLTLVYPLLAVVSEGFNLLVFGIRHNFFNPFEKDILNLIPYYFVTQSIFFAGAASFKKHPFAKTLLALALFQIALSIIGALLGRFIVGDLLGSLNNIQINETDLLRFSGNSISQITDFGRFAMSVAKVLFWGVMAPFFYVVAYFKLTEKEVCDGI